MNDPLDQAIPVGSGSTVPPADTPPPASPPPATPTSSVPASPPSGSDKIWAILSHVSSLLSLPIILPLIVYLAMRGESEYVAGNAKEALNFHISLLIYSICLLPLVFLLIGVPLYIVLAVGALVLSIVAAIRASDGIIYRYPLTLRLVK